MKKIILISFLVVNMFTNINGQPVNYSLDFDENNYSIQTFIFNDKEYKVRAYENIIYVANPIDTMYQKMNIYVPEEYYSNKEINGYKYNTAPIFFPNGIGGYMPAQPRYLNNNSKRNIFGQVRDQQRPMLPPPTGNMKEGSAINY